MKKFLSLATAAALSLSFVPTTMGLMVNKVLPKDSALYKSVMTRSMQMNDRSVMKHKMQGDVMTTIKKRNAHRVTARTARQNKIIQDMKKPVRAHPVRAYFIPESSSSSSSSTMSSGSAASSSSATSATSSH